MLLELFGNDFDLILNLSDEGYLGRKPGGYEYKQSINTLLSRDEFREKTINVGDLYMSDIMALNDSYDLHQLSKSRNSKV